MSCFGEFEEENIICSDFNIFLDANSYLGVKTTTEYHYQSTNLPNNFIVCINKIPDLRIDFHNLIDDCDLKKLLKIIY